MNLVDRSTVIIHCEHGLLYELTNLEAISDPRRTDTLDSTIITKKLYKDIRHERMRGGLVGDVDDM